MMSLLQALLDEAHDWRRRLWGGFDLDDPRPIAVGAPYTYFLPSLATLAAIAEGDLAQMVFRGRPPGRDYGAERMWVKVTSVRPEGLAGTLENIPCDMPQLKLGALVAFQPWHVIDVLFEDPARAPEEEPQRQYWERCLVDNCVLYDGVPVGYLYREAPEDWGDDAKFPDSGWRIRGDLRGLTDEALEARKASYVALGAVLNADDSWLALLDEPVGAAFDRDFERGGYTPAV